MTLPPSKKQRPLARLLTLAGYALCMGGIVYGMCAARESVLRRLGTASAAQEWQQWREQAARQPGRRQPKSEEPPLLILMRDYFPVMLGSALTAGTVFYSCLAFFIAGVMKTSSAVEQTSEQRRQIQGEPASAPRDEDGPR